MTTNKIEKWIGFYTTNSFLINKEPKIIKPSSPLSWDISRIFKLLSNAEIEYDCKFYNLRIFNGGIFALKLEEISFEKPDNDLIIRKILKGITYLNAIQLLFESSFQKHKKLGGYFTTYEINSQNTLKLDYEGNKLKGISGPLREEFYTNMRIENSINTNKIIFDDLNNDLENISKDYRNVEILAEISKSLSEYKIMNFSYSTLLSWIIIEKFLNILWSDLLKSKQNTAIINRTIREDLEDNSDFTAYIKSNVLKLFNIYDTEIFNKINRVRKERNDIMHPKSKNNNDNNFKICQDAFDIITIFLGKNMSLDLKFDLSFGYQI